MRFLEFLARAVLLFAVIFVVWFSIYGVASALGSNDAEGVANNGILVVGAVWAAVAYRRSRRMQRNT
jgi:ABC-type thiamin/hydroxymethylpyrimidine transport system permease subunit